MKKIQYLFLIITFATISAHADVTQYFNSIKNNPNALYAFLREMPKGGELHYHLAGSIYPEEIINIIDKNNYCFAPTTFSATTITEKCNGYTGTQIETDQILYDKLVRSWSMKDFQPLLESREQHFFDSFLKFLSLIGDYQGKMLALTMQRAALQNELYLEIMIQPKEGVLPPYVQWSTTGNTLAEKKAALLGNPTFQEEIKNAGARGKSLIEEAKKELGCTNNPTNLGCNITVKFQYYILREQDFDSFYKQAVLVFATVSQSQDYVGINLVQREDGLVALKEYHKQMEALDFLHSQYPQVHIALHAGELSPTDVAPETLRFHIQEAIYKGKAERIGHGASIAFENNVNALIEYMAKKPIPVEINLTSNQEILNIRGKNQPINYYLKNNVPIVLSTDDEGILRTDLTREYVKAVIDYQIDYTTLKNITRNTLTYSFLPGQSLWQTQACKQLQSSSCREFIKNNPKAQLQWQLEMALKAFEKKYD